MSSISLPSASSQAEKSWTAKGYPLLANLMGRYPEIAIFRKFGTLNHLNLLGLQADLVQIEEQYKECVKRDNASGDEKLSELSEDFYLHRVSGSEQAHMLRKQIRPLLREYNECLTHLSMLDNMQPAESRPLGTLRGWLDGEEEGRTFMKGYELYTWDERHGQDFVSLDSAKRERSTASKILNPRLIDLYYRWRPTSKVPKYVDAESGRLYDIDKSIGIRAARILFSICAPLVASLFPALTILILYYIPAILERIATAVALTVVFGLCLAAFTNASMKEIFTATATFAAVEVVYIGSANGT